MICICGHSKEEHSKRIVEVCNECINEYYSNTNNYLRNWEFIHNFKLDNLRYLEEKYSEINYGF